MYKRVVAGALLSALASIVAACGGSVSESSQDIQAPGGDASAPSSPPPGGSCTAPTQEDVTNHCNALHPLPFPNPIGVGDKAANCDAEQRRCTCATVELDMRMAAYHGCVCRRQTQQRWDQCRAAVPGSCPPSTHVDHMSCIAAGYNRCAAEAAAGQSACGEQYPAGSVAGAALVDISACIAQGLACKTGLFPGLDPL